MSCAPRSIVALGALLIAMAAAAQVPGREALRDLDGGPAFVAAIQEGVLARLRALEWARRFMLIGRCSALDRQFPRQPAPRMVAVAERVWAWSVRGGVPGVPDDQQRPLLLRLMPDFIDAAFTPAELAAWDAFRASPQGRRAIAIQGMRGAILQMDNVLVDVSSGVGWTWPLARLRDHADAQGLRPPLDLALDDILPGSRALLDKLSIVPGAEPNLPDLAEHVQRNAEELEVAFVRHLAPADTQAMRALEASPVYRRWPELTQALGEFVASAMTPAPSPGQIVPRPRKTAAEFCRTNAFARCSEPFLAALERYRSDAIAYGLSFGFENAVRQIVKQSPEAGCP